MKNLISFENFGSASHSVNEAEAAKEFDRTKPFSISPADPYEYKYYAPKKQWYTRNRSENNPKWKDMKKTLGSKFQVAYETIEGAIKAGKAVNVSGGAISSPYNSLIGKIATELKKIGPNAYRSENWKGATVLEGYLGNRSNKEIIYTDWYITPLGYYEEDRSKWKPSPTEGLLYIALNNKGGKEKHLESITKAVGKDAIAEYFKNQGGEGYDETLIKVNAKTAPLIPSLIAGLMDSIRDAGSIE